MKNKLQDRLDSEKKYVTKCILKGQSISQIALDLGCSTSTVSNRISKLFVQYNAKTRSQFVLNVLADVIKKDKDLIKKQKETIIEKDFEIDNLNTILSNLINCSSDEKKLFDYLTHIKSIRNETI